MKHFKKGEIKKRKKEMEKKGMFHVKHFRKRKIKKKKKMEKKGMFHVKHFKKREIKKERRR